MNNQPNISIVVPCYNEAEMLDIEAYKSFFIENPEVKFCFVNDGSTDDTLGKLNELISDNIHVCNLNENLGKAEAVRQGVEYNLNHFNSTFIAYFDADLSTPLSEIFHLKKHIELNQNLEFVFGSRILKVGSTIDRKVSRFLIGRVIATFISRALKLKVYDTQCGAKMFTSNFAKYAFRDKFISKWLFDVELIFRLLKQHGRKNSAHKMEEIPLNIWVEKGNSKLKWTYGFKVFFDLNKIKRNYKSV